MTVSELIERTRIFRKAKNIEVVDPDHLFKKKIVQQIWTGLSYQNKEILFKYDSIDASSNEEALRILSYDFTAAKLAYAAGLSYDKLTKEAVIKITQLFGADLHLFEKVSSTPECDFESEADSLQRLSDLLYG